MYRRFNEAAFDDWEAKTHIPERVMNMLSFICEKIGINAPEEETVPIHNIYGDTIGYSKGFTISICTYSIADGPDEDYSQELAAWLKGLDFVIENNSYTGEDSAYFYSERYVTYDFNYKPCEIYDDCFYEWCDPDDGDEMDGDDWEDCDREDYDY